MANAGAVASQHANEDDLIIMASNLMFSRAEIEAASQDLRALIATRAERMRDSFVEQTVKEINKRGWATL